MSLYIIDVFYRRDTKTLASIKQKSFLPIHLACYYNNGYISSYIIPGGLHTPAINRDPIRIDFR